MLDTGDNIPKLPQWVGPPPTIVQVQAILYASLVASLFSAFLAIWCQRPEDKNPHHMGKSDPNNSNIHQQQGVVFVPTDAPA